MIDLAYGWKNVRLWWYFHTFHENWDGVLLKIRLKTPTKIILEAVLFMYILTNTNIAGIKYSEVNGRRKTYDFFYFVLESDKNKK